MTTTAPTAGQKAVHEQSELRAEYLAYHRDLRRTAEAGPCGEDIKQLFRLIRDLTSEKGATRLCDFVEGSALPMASRELKTSICIWVAAATSRIRRRDGRPFAQDALPNNSPTVFQRVRAALDV
jgi:hypothetical protein